MSLSRNALFVALLTLSTLSLADVQIETFKLPNGAHPHDVAPDPDSARVWYTAQHQEALGILDPATGETQHVHLGEGSRPHGVIVGPDGNPWVTDGGLNAMVKVDAQTLAVDVYPLPEGTGYANLNTAAVDGDGMIWFTGQSGTHGKINPESGEVSVYDSSQGGGPYGIDSTPEGEIYYVSLAGSYLARIERDTGKAEVIEPPTKDQGARRVWSDSRGRLWISEWNSGQVSRYDPATEEWAEWSLPGENPKAYAVYVDERDKVWLSDFGANAVLRFDPETETFESFPSPRDNAAVRQLLGREGEVWAPESGTDHIQVYRYD